MIKFFFKIVIVLIIALAAVIYHNTESGREMERRIGEEIKIDNLSKKGREFLKEAIYFLSLKGLEYKKNNDDKHKTTSKSEPSSKKDQSSKKDAPQKDIGNNGNIQKSVPSMKGKVEKEHIEDADRKKLEDIIESEN